MSQFEYKEIDPEGRQMLEVIGEANRFNKWMYEAIKPYCTGKILEIGSGIGNLSQFFLDAKADLVLSDIRPSYISALQSRFSGTAEIIQLDLTHPQFDAEYSGHLGKYDSLFALNVVEHIRDDNQAVQNCHKLLRAGGKLVILVPAYAALYNRLDVELEHFRRYNRKKLNQLLENGQFQVHHSEYFNFMGIPAWFISGRLQGNKTIPRYQMSLFNSCVPLFRLIDRILFKRAGLSVISVGIKK